MTLALMVTGIIGWVTTGNGLFMAVAIISGLLFGSLLLGMFVKQ